MGRIGGALSERLGELSIMGTTRHICLTPVSRKTPGGVLEDLPRYKLSLRGIKGADDGTSTKL